MSLDRSVDPLFCFTCSTVFSKPSVFVMTTVSDWECLVIIRSSMWIQNSTLVDWKRSKTIDVRVSGNYRGLLTSLWKEGRSGRMLIGCLTQTAAVASFIAPLERCRMEGVI